MTCDAKIQRASAANVVYIIGIRRVHGWAQALAHSKIRAWSDHLTRSSIKPQATAWSSEKSATVGGITSYNTHVG